MILKSWSRSNVITWYTINSSSHWKTHSCVSKPFKKNAMSNSWPMEDTACDLIFHCWKSKHWSRNI